jgi:branched-chain amino acid transport system ATP-binding protein
LLRLNGVSAGYRGLQIIQDLSFEVNDGEVLALIGANGAGKTTTLRTISGFLRPTAGEITFDGEHLQSKSPHTIVRAGIVHVPEERELFGSLTVTENLLMGAYAKRASERESTLSEVLELFPVLGKRSQQVASTMSGGEQQMLAIGRALMARPRLLMLDEPSQGLAPKLVSDVFEAVERIRHAGITVLIVEQNAAHTLRLADRACVIESGRLSLEGTGSELLQDGRVRSAYLGL